MENNETPVVVVEQQEEKRRRSSMAIFLSVALVAVLGIGGTFAYLTYTTNQTPNRFTTDPNITADILEPTWTYGSEQSKTNKADATKTAQSPDGVYIPVKAGNMLPSYEVDKNPFIVNTSKNGAEEWVAMKLQFQKWNDGKVETEGQDYSGTWVNMNDKEVEALMACYGFLQADGSNASKAGLNNYDATNNATGNKLGTGWTQIVNKLYYDGTNAGTAGKANTSGAMYFYYSTAVKAETKAEVAAEKKYDGTTNTDIYNVIPSDKRTTALFTDIRFCETATQTQINTLMRALKGTTLTGTTDGFNTSAGSSLHPAWRVVVSGAAVAKTDKSGEAAADFIVDPSNASATALATGVNYKDLCDQMAQTDSSATNYTTEKPTTISGIRVNTGNTGIPEALKNLNTGNNPGVGAVSD